MCMFGCVAQAGGLSLVCSGYEIVGLSQSCRRKDITNFWNPAPALVFLLLTSSQIGMGGLARNKQCSVLWLALPSHNTSNRQISQRLLCRLSYWLEWYKGYPRKGSCRWMGCIGWLSLIWVTGSLNSNRVINNSFKEWLEWQNGASLLPTSDDYFLAFSGCRHLLPCSPNNHGKIKCL